jgi:hypothetical protein
MRLFETLDTQDVETLFAIEQVEEMDILEDWLNSTTTLTQAENDIVIYLRKKLLQNADFWNEDELKLQFIAPLLLVVNYDFPDYKVFSQRTLTATVNGIEIGGRVDFMIAKGKQRPTNPFFFIHEYKQESKRGASDPKGQLLAELLAAQTRNADNLPMYGCYVVGRSWFFVVLNGNEYAVSDAYVATQKTVYDIIAILRRVKNILAAIRK